jgi:hypothetical protein
LRKESPPGADPGRGGSRRRRSGLTAGQKRVLDFLEACRREGKVAPTIREIAAACGIRSTATVSGVLSVLEERGLILRDGNSTRRVSRGIMLRRARSTVGSPDALSIPILDPGAPEEFWTGQQRGIFTVDRRLSRGRTLAAVRLPRAEESAAFSRESVTWLIVERAVPEIGEAGAYRVPDGVLAGVCYQAGPWWRFFDLITGAETIMAPENAGTPFGRVVAVITIFDASV